MTQPESAFRRVVRPGIGWNGLLLGFVCTIFILGLGAITLYALWRWANGLPVDLTGFAAVVAAAVPAGAYVQRLCEQYMNARHTERMDQQARGIPPSGVPFDSSPAEGGPRPGDSP